MTRPRGTVPVTLARHRAVAVARWLSTYVVPEKTVLGTAGMSEAEILADRESDLRLLSELVCALSAQRIGRPRLGVSNYHLSVEALKLIDIGHAALTMPRKLRPVIRQLLRATRRRKGPKLPPAIRARNMANGGYAPETVRRYRWLERKALARQAMLESLGSSSDWPISNAVPPKAGTAAYAVAAVVAARHWLV